MRNLNDAKRKKADRIYGRCCFKAFSLSDKIFANSERNVKLGRLSMKYLRNLEYMFEKCDRFLFVTGAETFDKKVDLLRIILSVRCPEMEKFINLVANSKFEGIPFDNGVYDFLQVVCMLDTYSKINMLSSVLKCQINDDAKIRFVEAIIYGTQQGFKTWVFSTLVAHAETKQDREFFGKMLSRNLFDEEVVEREIKDKVVGDLCAAYCKKQGGETEQKPAEEQHTQPEQSQQPHKETTQQKTK